MKKEEKKKEYVVTMIVNGRKFEGKGESVHQALASIKMPRAKSRGVLVVERGKIKKERVLTPLQVLQLTHFAGMNKELTVKRTALVFEGI